MPFGNPVFVMVMPVPAGATAIVNACDCMPPALSVTVIVNVVVPAAAGAPPIAPLTKSALDQPEAIPL